MRDRLRLILCVVTAVVTFSCEDNNHPNIYVESVGVTNNETSALKARVNVVVSDQSLVQVKYWTDDENAAQLSEVSETGKKNHVVPLFNLKENTTYHYRVLIISANPQPEGEIQTFTTASIPSFVKEFYKESENVISDESDGYYLFASMIKPGCLYLVDKTGKIVWYRTTPNVIKAARISRNNTVVTLEDTNNNQMGDGNIVLETSWADDTISYHVVGKKGFDKMAHHDVQIDKLGNTIVITNEVKDGYPGDGLLVLDRQGQKLWSWSTFDAMEINPVNYKQPWGNSLFIDSDNNYIVSFRSLCQVWKINSTTGAVIWKFGKNGDVEFDDDDNQFMFQHFAHRNKFDEIMVFDNGDASRPRSRAISFTINETTKKATTQINTFLPDNLYSAIMGSTSFLEDGNILAASAVNGTIVKMNTSGEVMWTLKTANRIYRVVYVEDPF